MGLLDLHVDADLLVEPLVTLVDSHHLIVEQAALVVRLATCVAHEQLLVVACLVKSIDGPALQQCFIADSCVRELRIDEVVLNVTLDASLMLLCNLARLLVLRVM